MKSRYQGSITVFLAMIFFMIVSVVLVSLESARVSAVKSGMVMAISQSMDSILAKYYKPLFEEYRIFGRYEKQDVVLFDQFQQEMIEQLEYTSNPMLDLENQGGNAIYPLPAKVSNLSIPEIVYLTDHEGEGFYLQAVDTMQVMGAEELLQKMLKGCKQMEEIESASKAYEMQSDIVEEVAELDEITLEMMCLIDGITIKDDELQFKKSGLLKVQDSFVKQYVTYPISTARVGINHDLVYESVASSYINKDQVFQKAISLLEDLIEIDQSIETKEEEYEELSQRYDTMAQERASKKGAKKGKEEEKEDISELDALSEQMSSLSNEISDLQEEKNEKIKTCEKEISQIESSLDQCKCVIEKAIDKAEEGISKQASAKESIKEYEENLDELKEGVSEDVQKSLDDELHGMKQYVSEEEGTKSINYDYNAMSDTLYANLEILKDKITYLKGKSIGSTADSFQNIIGTLKKNQMEISKYSINNLFFDYSTINTKQNESLSPIKRLKKLINDGTLDLVVEDMDKISKFKIKDKTNLVSTVAAAQKAEKDGGGGLKLLNAFKDNIMGDLFDEFSGLVSGEESVGDVASSFTQTALFQIYVDQFFKDYIVLEEPPKIETVTYPSVLEYEKEYICFGHESDQENLASMVSTMIFLRLIINMVKIFSDPAVKAKAQALAVTLVAFTGLAVLVTITEYLIMIVYAMIESLVDVAIILKGKELDMMNKGKYHVKFEELLGMSKELIMERANAYQAGTKTTISYDQLVFFILLLQSQKNKTYRAMDLIQENVNLRYEGGFRFHQCAYGLKAEVDYVIKSMFIGKYISSDGLECHRKFGLTY